MQKKTRTPCVGICSTTYGDEVCRGCKRFYFEVINWNKYDEDEKDAIWTRLESLKTQIIYSKIKKHSSKTVFNKRAVKKRNSFLNLLINSRNDLQSVVEKKHPRLKTILNNISLQKGCYFSRMTGSGSVCYGLFINLNSAKKARINLKKIYPKFWVSIAKTV